MWTTAMIALPNDLHDEAHCTIEFLGESEEIQASPEGISNALKEFQFEEPLEVRVIGTRIFGIKTGEPVIVALLDSHDLTPIFETVSKALSEKLGVENKSSYADEKYKPHVTIKPFESYADLESLDLPETLTLGPLELWWNEERIKI